jgi:Zn-dependent protease
MAWSLKLFTVRSIPVRIHFTFLLIMAWAAYRGFADSHGAGMLASVGFMEAFVILLFACVVLHELAHALVAQLFGLAVQDITLWPLGGVARMARMPESPFQEFTISAAGPAMNILLTIALGGLLLIWAGQYVGATLLTNPALFARVILDGADGRSLLAVLVFNNALLAMFNLIPAFPMDGGRMLRAALAMFTPYVRATQAASWVAQIVAVAMVVAAFASPGLLALALVGLLVFFAAGVERQRATMEGEVRGVCVHHILQPIGRQLHPVDTLAHVASHQLHSLQTVYLVVDGGRLVGMLTRESALDGLRRHGSDARVGHVMNRDFLQVRPTDALSAARDQMAQRRARTAVVVENGEVLGTLSENDIVRLNELLRAFPGLLAGE